MAHQQHHHHHHHGGFNAMNSSYAHHNLQNHHAGAAAHFTQLNSFQQHSTILHHPQPLSFGTLLHPTPLMPNSGLSQHAALAAAGKFTDQQKLSSGFDFPSLNSNFYKPLGQQLQQFSPTNSKSTISIDSSSASSASERMMSPHSTVDSHCGNNATPPPAPATPTKNSTQVTAQAETNAAASFSASSASSVSSFTAVTNGKAAASQLSQQTTRANMQNGLLDILMSPDKYQEFIQYHQAQNSIIFPTLHHAAYQIDALNPRLPTWEFLQVSWSVAGVNDACMHVILTRGLHSSSTFVLMTETRIHLMGWKLSKGLNGGCKSSGGIRDDNLESPLELYFYPSRKQLHVFSSWPFVGSAVWFHSRHFRNPISSCCCKNPGRNFSCWTSHSGVFRGTWRRYLTAHRFVREFLTTPRLVWRWKPCRRFYVAFDSSRLTPVRSAAWKQLFCSRQVRKFLFFQLIHKLMKQPNCSPDFQQKQLDFVTFSPLRCFKTKRSASSPTMFACVIHASQRASAVFFSCFHPSGRSVRQQLSCYSLRKQSATFRSPDCWAICTWWKNTTITTVILRKTIATTIHRTMPSIAKHVNKNVSLNVGRHDDASCSLPSWWWRNYENI